MSKWLDAEKRSLGPDDNAVRTWPGRFNKSSCHIVLSKKGLLLVEEHGFIHQTVDVLQEIPYETITKIRTDNPNQLALTTSDGGEHHITSSFLSILERTLEDLMNPEKSKA